MVSGRLGVIFELEHLVMDGQVRRERRAHGQVAREDHDPLVVFADPTSSSARIIPAERTPRSLASPSFVPSA